MTQDKVILFSSLYEEENIESLLKRLFSVSRNKLKNSGLKKEFLNKKVRKRDLIKLPIDLVNILMINPIYNGPEVKIISNKSNILAVSKPSFAHIHPLRYSDDNNLLSFLRSTGKYHEYLTYKASTYDRSLLYRIDFETSGLVLLSNDNNKKNISMKCYFAVVRGEYSKFGSIKNKITTSGQKIKVSERGLPVECITFPLEYNKEKNMTLVGVFLKEGKRHQIRVQLSFLGFPIIGDLLYGDKPESIFGLHCFCYELDDQFYKDSNIPFLSLFTYFLNLDSNFQVLCNKFRNS